MAFPELIAHRGASRERPENTVAAFRRAVELGADGVELDVHLTTDGVLVVHHDAVPHAAPDPALAGRPLHELSSAEVARFRVDGEPIPTLREVIDAVGARLTVYCELKGAGTAAPACALLASSAGTHAVHAFDHRQVAEARRLAPAIARGVLEVSYHVDPLAGANSVDARDIWQDWTMIDAPLVRAAHAAGKRIVAWTVDDEAVVRALTSLGVDALCTNDVALARRVLGR
ncbi:MAG: glycerophosphodiester phosphodiesterase [Gemmatimonadetes bacterium]|nr:glycerophosphodiester phosphodiesterase [Gemmatimonadota bacterium]